MSKTSTLAAALLLAAFGAGASAQGSMGAGELGWRDAAPASASVKTRAQVLAELRQAQRDGDVVAAGDIGLAPRAAYAPSYAGLTKTRAEVKAELAEARRNGEVVVGDSSLTLREEFPQRYPLPRVNGAPTLAQRDAR